MDKSLNLLLTPKAKRNVSFTREYPFPIVNPGCEIGQVDRTWKIAEGFLEDNFVLVHDEDSIRRIYNMGFYGKGTLSKHAPGVCYKKVQAPVVEKQKLVDPDKPKDDDVIDVIDSDDEDINVKKENAIIEVVLSDSSCDEESINKASTSKKWENVPTESLQLTLEEAYFLSYGLGCLIVKIKNQMQNLSSLWIKCCELTDWKFPVMYTAYHHFRSKGWIVKSGLKFGADYVLYKDGPPFYHATYSVIVKAIKGTHLRELPGYKQFTWAKLLALNRVNSTAGKGLLFLYVLRPKTMSEDKMLTPYCISEFKVEEVLFNRWVPEQNREEDVDT